MGRVEILAQLETLWRRVIAGERVSLLVQGQPGVGKTRLLQQLTGELRAQGAHTWWAHAPSQAGAPALWPFIQILRAGRAAGAISDLQLAAFGEMFAPFLPEPRVRTTSHPARAESRFWVFDRMTHLLDSLSRHHPLCLVFEDLHAYDAASLELLHHLVRELQVVPLLLIASCRDCSPEHVQAPALAELAAAMPCRLRLSGLTQAEVGLLLARTLQPEAASKVAAEVHRRTDGNPLYVGALAPALAARSLAELDGVASLPLPESLRLAVVRRFDRLPERCRQLLRSASVLGREVDRDLLCAIHPQDERCDELAAARAHDILERVPDAPRLYRFTHALLVEVLYAELSEPERAQLHAAAASALERSGRSDPLARSQLARHSLRAGGRDNWERAARVARSEATSALERRAHAESIEQFQVALAAIEQLCGASSQPSAAARGECLRELSGAHFAAGEVELARERLREASELAEALADHGLLARCALDGAARSSVLELAPEQLRRFEQVCAAPDVAPVLRARVMAALGARLCGKPERARGLRWIERAEQIAEGCGDLAARLDAMEARHVACLGVRPLQPRSEQLPRWRELAQRAADPRQLRRVMYWRIVHAFDAGDAAGLDELLQQYEALARDGSDPWSTWESLWFGCSRALLRGNLDGAESQLSAALEMGQRAQAQDAPRIFGLQLLELRRLQGRGAELIPALQLSAERHTHVKGFRALICSLHAELGQLVEARTHLARAHGECMETVEQLPALFPLCQLAQAACELGDAERGRELYAALLPFEARCAATASAIICEGSVARFLGLAALAAGDCERATAHLETALLHNQRLGALPWVAWTQWDLARLYQQVGERGERARQLAAEAHAAAQRLGMRELARRSGELCASWPLASAAARPNERSPAQPALFRRDGEVWQVSYAGCSVRLRSCLGMQYLALLLGRPGHARHVLDVVAEVQGIAQPSVAPAASEGLHARERAAAGRDDVIDAASVRLYRGRVQSLVEELEQARDRHDLGTLERKQAELTLLRRELTARLRARHRPSERARKAVYNRLRSALARIERAHPRLARHLEASLKTGTHCEYRPERAQQWLTT